VFTGLIAELGVLERIGEIAAGRRFRVRAPRITARLEQGASVAVNGVCLTVTDMADAEAFEAVAVGETLRRTTLKDARPGQRVHLEPALRLGDPMGGHWVQGHVDATARVLEVRSGGADVTLSVELPPALERYLVERGSIAVDGVSLTVAGLSSGLFRVALIPETWERTLFREKRPGDPVNLEVDILAKYAVKALSAGWGEAAGASASRLVWEGWNREEDHGRIG
jgi:riboflavin synthase